MPEELRRGDIIMANEILDISGRRLSIDLKAEAAAGVHVGRLLTVDKIIRDPKEKRSLGEIRGSRRRHGIVGRRRSVPTG